MNSFLALRDEDFKAFSGERHQTVRRRVERNLRTAEFLASVVELFGPVMADTVNVLGGGQSMLDGDSLRTYSEMDDDDPFGAPPRGPGQSVRY